VGHFYYYFLQEKTADDEPICHNRVAALSKTVPVT